MREFATIEGFLKHLQTLHDAVVRAAPTGLEAASALVEQEAKASIGHYQEATGPFNAWVPLSGATLDGFVHADGFDIPGKIELGYAAPGEDNPLLRDGTLRDSYKHTVQGLEAATGSEEENAVWQELGTPNALYPIPPRSILGGATSRNKDEIVDMMLSPVVRALAGLPPRNRPKAEAEFT